MPDEGLKFDFSVLRLLRTQRNLTIADLSTSSGVSAAVISKLERNLQSAELDTVFRLSRALGMSATDLMALVESPLVHRTAEEKHCSASFKFRQVRFANVLAMEGTAPAGAMLSRPEIHRDDNELCWVLEGRLRLVLPHEVCELSAGESIQFDAILEHTYHALKDCRFLILHLRKDKRY